MCVRACVCVCVCADTILIVYDGLRHHSLRANIELVCLFFVLTTRELLSKDSKHTQRVPFQHLITGHTIGRRDLHVHDG